MYTYRILMYISSHDVHISYYNIRTMHREVHKGIVMYI